MAINLKNEKDKLIERNQSKTFFLHEENKDPLKQKAIERQNNNDKLVMNISKRFKNENFGVNQYYKNCVENYNNTKDDDKDKINQLKTIRSRSSLNRSLKMQVFDKQTEVEKQKFIDKKKDIEYVEKCKEQIEKVIIIFYLFKI
jgi:hypothetical protein